ncbi:unnamed protein product [Boreogadus saida]
MCVSMSVCMDTQIHKVVVQTSSLNQHASSSHGSKPVETLHLSADAGSAIACLLGTQGVSQAPNHWKLHSTRQR